MYFKTRNNAPSRLSHGETQGIWLNNITFRDLVIWAPVNNSLGLVITYCREAKSFTKVKCFALEPPPVALRSTFFYYYLPSLCKPFASANWYCKEKQGADRKNYFELCNLSKVHVHVHWFSSFIVLSRGYCNFNIASITECISICWLYAMKKWGDNYLFKNE